MRIVMVAEEVGGGYGQERVSSISTRLLREKGHDVFFIAARAGEESENALEIPGLFQLQWLSSPLSIAKATSAIQSYLTEINPDLIHLVDVPESRIVKIVSSLWPTVSSAHTVAPTCPASHRMIRGGGACEKKSGWSCIKHNRDYDCLSFLKNDLRRAHAVGNYLLKKRALFSNTLIAAISEYIEKLLLFDGWPKNQVWRVPNPVSVPPHETLHQETPPHLIFTASRLVPLKGIDFSLKALSELKHIPWSYWIAGEGPEKERLGNLVSELGLNSRIRFLGRQSHDEVLGLMERCSLYLQSNQGPEAFGLSAAEASLLAKPVIGTDIPALNEIVQNGRTGVLVPHRDHEALANAIQRTLENHDWALSLGTAAQNFVGKSFSVERHFEALATLYQRAIFERKALKQAS